MDTRRVTLTVDRRARRAGRQLARRRIGTTALLGSPLPHALASRGIPLVLVNREVDGAPADSCVTDNRCGATLVANLLAESGHRAIAAVFGPSETSTGRDREAGLSAGLGDHGIDLRPGLVRRGPFSYQPDYAATLELIDLPTDRRRSSAATMSLPWSL